jgi:hypothetical protein
MGSEAVKEENILEIFRAEKNKVKLGLDGLG